MDAVRINAKAKKPKKTIFTELRGGEANRALFFSPAKIQAARDLHIQQAEQAEELRVQKVLVKEL
jgi:hypothetical protein